MGALRWILLKDVQVSVGISWWNGECKVPSKSSESVCMWYYWQKHNTKFGVLQSSLYVGTVNLQFDELSKTHLKMEQFRSSLLWCLLAGEEKSKVTSLQEYYIVVYGTWRRVISRRCFWKIFRLWPFDHHRSQDLTSRCCSCDNIWTFALINSLLSACFQKA